jgi:hypothetical protein
MAFPRAVFLKKPKLKCWLTYTPNFISLLYDSWLRLRFPSYPGTVSRDGLLSPPPCAESPFAQNRCYLFWHNVLHHVRRRCPSFIAHTGSCARPNSSRRLRNPCVGAWTPTPQRPFSAFARFFLKDNGLTLDVRGSARQICPCNATSTGKSISRLQSFLYVQAPTLARPPGCTHRSC